MSSSDQFEIVGQISGQPLTLSNTQSNDQIAIGLEQELGLFILAHDPFSSDQSIAKKSIDILFDDMGFNLDGHSDLDKEKVSNCLHESIDNINEYLIEQNQLTSDEITRKGISLASIQNHHKGISCSMHGDVCGLKLSNEEITFLSSKISSTKALGTNPKLTFAISEFDINEGDILFLSTFSFAEKIDHEFIRLTLSRFSHNLNMASRQIHSRASQNKITENISFVICRKNPSSNEKKGWLSKFH